MAVFLQLFAPHKLVIKSFVSLGATMDIDELEKRLASTIVAQPAKEDRCAVDNKTGRIYDC